MGVRVVNPTSSPVALKQIPYVTLTTDTEVEALIQVETDRATAVEAALDSKIVAETARATAAEGALDTKIDAEVARATAAEGALDTKITAETNRATAAETQLQQNINAEIAARIAADDALDIRINDERDLRVAGDAALDAKIDQEISDRQAGDAQLQANIDAEASLRQAADAQLQSNIDNETALRVAQDVILQGNIDAESIQRQNGDAALEIEINNEKAARIAADTVLDGKIAAEVARATSAEQIIAANLVNEIAARTAADSELETKIELHINDLNNPHNTTLQKASDEQGAVPTVIQDAIYEDAATAASKLLTRAEVQAEIGSPVRYKGQLKYGAMTIADMNSILGSVDNKGLAIGDSCGVQATGFTYKWDGTNWIQQPQNADQTGDMYDILFWYGTWIDGRTYVGEVSAQIKCKDGATHDFDLLVNSDILLDNEVTDPKIGNRTLVDQAGVGTIIPVAAKNFTQWLQGIRNNLKWLFDNKADKGDFDSEVQDRINGDNDLLNKFNSLKGFYLGTYATIAALPSTLAGARVGDWALVRQNLNGAPALMRISVINAGTITWVSEYAWNLYEPFLVTLSTPSGQAYLVVEGRKVTFNLYNFAPSGNASMSTWYDSGILIPQEYRPGSLTPTNVRFASGTSNGTDAIAIYIGFLSVDRTTGQVWYGGEQQGYSNRRYSGQVSWYRDL